MNPATAMSEHPAVSEPCDKKREAGPSPTSLVPCRCYYANFVFAASTTALKEAGSVTAN